MSKFLKRAVPMTLVTVGLATAVGLMGMGRGVAAPAPEPQATDVPDFPKVPARNWSWMVAVAATTWIWSKLPSTMKPAGRKPSTTW